MSTARRNAFPSTTHINVVDVMEVVVVMWLEARHRSSENLAALFEYVTCPTAFHCIRTHAVFLLSS